MLFRRIARQTDPGGECVSTPPHPFVFWIPVSDYGSEGKTCGSMPRRERPSSSPEFAGPAGCGGKLAIERELERQIDGSGSTHRGKCGKSGISQMRPMFATPCSKSQSRGPEFEAESNIGPEARSLDQRFGLNPVVCGPVHLCDEYSRSGQNREFPCQIAGPDGVSGNFE